MKKTIALICAIIAIAFNICACTQSENNSAQASTLDKKKLKVIATLFPQYDFVRQIARDSVDLILLLPPGVESHTYEPTPNDMKAISDADVFVYTGEDMEPWAKRIIDGIDSDSLKVIDASENIELHEEEAEDHADEHAEDPHIWLDPVRATVMVDNIEKELAEAVPENAQMYAENAQQYKDKLSELDKEFTSAVQKSAHKTLVFGGRFAFLYLTDRYGIKYISAYDSCSSENEPSMQRMAQIIEFIKENDIKVVYHEELVDPKIAKSIAKETGAQLLELHSAHNVTPEQLKSGITYIDLMKKNLENIAIGLG